MKLLTLHRVNYRPADPTHQKHEWFASYKEVQAALKGDRRASYASFAIDPTDPAAIVGLLNENSL